MPTPSCSRRLSERGGCRRAAGDIVADRAIAEVRERLDYALRKGGVAPDVLILVARAFARAEIDPGRALQEAMMGAMEPAVSRTKLRGRHEGAEAELHGFIASFA